MVEVKPKEQKLIVVEALFVEEISGMAISKLLDEKEQIKLNNKTKIDQEQGNTESYQWYSKLSDI